MAEQSTTTTTTLPAKAPRDQVKAACEQCRVHKVKCTGERPLCGRCSLRGLDCQWVSHPHETRHQALARSCDTISERASALEHIFSLVQTMSEPAAQHLYRQIRDGGTPETVLRDLGEAELLLELRRVSAELNRRYELPGQDSRADVFALRGTRLASGDSAASPSSA